MPIPESGKNTYWSWEMKPLFGIDSCSFLRGRKAIKSLFNKRYVDARNLFHSHQRIHFNPTVQLDELLTILEVSG